MAGTVEERLAALESLVQSLGGSEASQPNYLTVDQAGNVSAAFSGHVSAQGVDLPSYPDAAASPPATSRVRWLQQSDGTMVASVTGYGAIGGDANYEASAQSLNIGSAAYALLSAFDDLGTRQAWIRARQINRGGSSGILFTGIDLSVAGATRTLLDQAQRSSFLQLLSTQKLQLDHGTGTWTWPGGSTTSNLATIAHGLGSVPVAVLIEPNVDQGAGAGTLIAHSVSGKTTTQFQTRAGFQTFAPGAGATTTFDWVAFG